MNTLATITPHVEMIRSETPDEWVTACTATEGPSDVNGAREILNTRDPAVMSTRELAAQMKAVMFILPEVARVKI